MIICRQTAFQTISTCAPTRRVALLASRWRTETSRRARHSDALQGAKQLAFAFDIDGVLIRGADVLPQAQRALKFLEGGNPLGIRVPYILMTNGGGRSERDRCTKLTKQLGVEISESQFLQAHTILKSGAHKYADVPVLVLGGTPGVLPRVAADYGFKNVYTTLDILAWNQSIWPFHSLDATEREFTNSRPPFDPTTRIAAVFVFHDPRNWALDIQVISDILRNGGYVAPEYAEDRSVTDDKCAPHSVDLVFCNPDLLWGSDFPVPRFGQGAFRLAFQAVYKARNGHEYPYVQYGKPTEATYRFAEHLLLERIKQLRPDQAEGAKPSIWMIGDNPEADIAGANAIGWKSILVETGVYDKAEGSPRHQPTRIVRDVEGAVALAFATELANS